MKLNIEQIRKITRGAVRIEQEQDGVHFHRFTKSQEELYRNVSENFFMKSHATAGVRIEFLTDSKTLEIKTNISSGSSRTYFAFEVFVNGKLYGTLANFDEDDVTENYISAEYEHGKFHEIEELIRKTVKPYDNITVISGYDFVPKEERYFSDRRLHPNDAGFEHYFSNLHTAISRLIT